MNFDLVSPDINSPLRVVFLEAKPFTAFTHFVDPRTYPCVDVPGGCPHCLAEAPRRWYGYIAAMVVGERRRVCLRITEYAAGKAPWLMKPPTPLRGVVATYYRIPTKSRKPGWETRGRCYFSAPEPDPHDRDLPAAFSSEELLWQMWEAETHQFAPYSDRRPRIQTGGEPTF